MELAEIAPFKVVEETIQFRLAGFISEWLDFYRSQKKL
jgi:hypothetical protein